ncbi:unnamed protein product [Moneuplotes crassus]|uniref:Uncharacterized protein n=1 Tax=Euplotes crassus TaxID=5936 RepID=A0AAD1U3H3_EUPCR|nr:unnamed protein product [Moneuplotes crassus]
MEEYVNVKQENQDEDEYVDDILLVMSQDKLKKIRDPFILDSSPLHRKISQALGQINNLNAEEERTWTQLSENVKALMSLLEFKINTLNKSLSKISNQQYRMEYAENLQKRKEIEPKQEEQDDGNFSWNKLWKKIDTVGSKTLQKSESTLKDVNSVFAEFSELHMSYETATCKQFGMTKPRSKDTKSEGNIKQEEPIQPSSQDVEDGKNMKNEVKSEDEDSFLDDLLTDPDEFNKLKLKIKRPCINMLKFTKTQGHISRDLDRFITKRVEKDQEYTEINENLIKSEGFDFNTTQMLNNSQDYDMEMEPALPLKRRAVSKIQSQIEKLQRKPAIKAKKRVVKEYERICVRNYKIFNNKADSNRKIDELINESISIARTQRNLKHQTSIEISHKKLVTLKKNLNKERSEFLRIYSQKLISSHRNLRILLKNSHEFIIPDLRGIKDEYNSDANYDFEINSSDGLDSLQGSCVMFDPQEDLQNEDIHLDLYKIKAEIGSDPSAGLHKSKIEPMESNNVIELDSCSDKGSQEQLSKDRKTLRGKKRVKEELEDPSDDSKNDINNDNDFDYCFDGQKGIEKLPISRTIDLKKVKKIIAKNVVLEIKKKSFKRIKTECEEEVNKKNVPSQMFGQIFKNMRKKNPSLSIQSFFIASLHSIKETDIALKNVEGDAQLDFIVNEK